MSIDEAITKYRQNAEYFKSTTNVAYSLELEQIAEWLEKLKYIENIILRWNADWYNDEDNGIPDNEILEAIFNACNDNGFDIPIDEDFSKGYNKAIDDFKNKWDSRVKDLISWCKDCRLIGLQQADLIFDEIAEQLKAGGENE